jgi:hypothetical protein
VAPACDFLHQRLRDELFLEEKREDLAGEHLSQQAVGKSGDMMEAALSILASLAHQEVGMGIEIYLLSERLDGGHNTRTKLCAGRGLEVVEESLDSRMAEGAQKPALVLE